MQRIIDAFTRPHYQVSFIDRLIIIAVFAGAFGVAYGGACLWALWKTRAKRR